MKELKIKLIKKYIKYKAVSNELPESPIFLKKKKPKSFLKTRINNFNNNLSLIRADERFYSFNVQSPKAVYNTYKVKYATNNIFCHIFNSEGKTLHPAKSFGNYKINVSKKNKQKRIKDLLQRYSNEIISNKRIRRTITPTMTFKLEIKNRIRKRVIRWICGMVVKKILKFKSKRKAISKAFGKKQKFIFAFDFTPQKPFNGCRAVIFRRKKRLYPHFKKKYA